MSRPCYLRWSPLLSADSSWLSCGAFRCSFIGHAATFIGHFWAAGLLNMLLSIAAYSTLNHWVHVGISLSYETCKFFQHQLSWKQPHFTRIVHFSMSDKILGNLWEFITFQFPYIPFPHRKVCSAKYFLWFIRLVPFLVFYWASPEKSWCLNYQRLIHHKHQMFKSVKWVYYPAPQIILCRCRTAFPAPLYVCELLPSASPFSEKDEIFRHWFPATLRPK